MDTLYLILTVILVAIGVWIFFKILSAPIRLLLKFILNAALGFLMLFIVNLIGYSFGFSVTVNLLTALISGIFGIPGIIAIVLFQILF